MEVSKKIITKMRITGADGLDPIDVYLDVLGEKEGHITIICYGMAWTTYFGSMGLPMVDFIKGCNASYLLNRFGNGADKKRTKQAEIYLLRIIEAVQAALREESK